MDAIGPRVVGSDNRLNTTLVIVKLVGWKGFVIRRHFMLVILTLKQVEKIKLMGRRLFWMYK